jgi:serine/threonine protein kinase
MDDRYKTVKKAHGEGGFGKVSIYMDSLLERQVAVKKLLYPDTQNKERFHREAKILAKLSHAFIPSIFDLSFEEDEFFIIFEYIDGTNLREYIERGTIPDISTVQRWFTQIALAIDHAHQKKILHRDIKPENIIISKDERSAVLVDFGIALSGEDTRNLKKRGYIIGTPGYMAPEVPAGQSFTEASDFYSLGVTLYELMSGKLPLVDAYISLSGHNESIPPAIDELIKACLVTNHNERINNAKDFINSLHTALRSDIPFSALLTESRLHEIQEALTRLSPEEFHSKPIGQRLLVINRVKDLIRAEIDNMKKPTAGMISILLKIGMLESKSNYKPIVDAALNWGLEMFYGTEWQGDDNIRDSLKWCAKNYNKEAHQVASQSVLEYAGKFNLREKPKWWLHSLRDIVTSLLANPNSENDAEALAILYDNINTYSHNESQND